MADRYLNKRNVSYAKLEMEEESEKDESPNVEKKISLRISKYDLPIDYHEDWLRSMDSSQLGSIRSRDFSWLSDRRTLASLPEEDQMSDNFLDSTMRYLKPEVLKEVIDEKPNYQFLSNMAIRKLQNDIIKQLKVLHPPAFCSTKNYYEHSNIPERPFSWTRTDFSQRRKLPNALWVDALFREMSENCLHSQKFKSDIKVLIYYLSFIFKDFLTDNPNFNAEKEVFDKIVDLYQLLPIQDELKKEFEENSIIFKKQCSEIVLLNSKRTVSKNEYKKLLRDQLKQIQFISPIELRYQFRYYRSKAALAEYKLQYTENSYEKQIDELNKKIEREKYCSQCACNSLYVDTDIYKTRFKELSETYDKEYDDIDNKIQYNRLKIDKQREQKKVLQEQIVRFQEKIKVIIARIIAEKAEEKRLALERLAAELRKEEAKARKELLKKEKKAKREKMKIR